MEILHYSFVTDRDLEKCEQLRAPGLMLPSLAFAIKPKFCSDGSAEFKLSMMVPAFMWIGLAVAVAAVWITTNRLGGPPSQYPAWFGVVICGFIAIAAYTYRSWRSVRIWPDGRTQLSVPRLLGRRVVSFQPGETRLLLGLSYGRSDRVKAAPRAVPSQLMLNSGRPKYHSQPCLVIAIGNSTIPLARKDSEGIRTLIQMLTEDYSLSLDPSPVLYRYQGFIL